jgi:hypothetical protein
VVVGNGSLGLTGEVEWVGGLCVGGAWRMVGVAGAEASLLGIGGLRRRGLYSPASHQVSCRGRRLGETARELTAYSQLLNFGS